MTAAIALAALLLDRWLGEPPRWHPLELFGRLALHAEARLYADSLWRGASLTLLLVLPPVLLAAAASVWLLGWLVELLVLYLATGWRSLAEHARAVSSALKAEDLAEARKRVAFLVSRDTQGLDAAGITKAAVESVLENGNDALFGALFWYLAAGAPGVVAYRLVNTLDAMWGYRTSRYNRFGRAAARLDDLLNWVPARLTALAYALSGDARRAFDCWRRQGRAWMSPNAGPVMAAGAGALRVRLGGAAVYDGQVVNRPPLGVGEPVAAKDIERALGLLRRAVWLWLVVIAAEVLSTAW